MGGMRSTGSAAGEAAPAPGKKGSPLGAGRRPHRPPALLAAACPSYCQGLTVDPECLARLGEVGERTSLRHAVQLLTPSSIVAKTSGRDAILKVDVDDVADLFIDAKASAKLLTEQAEKYLQ